MLIVYGIVVAAIDGDIRLRLLRERLFEAGYAHIFKQRDPILCEGGIRSAIRWNELHGLAREMAHFDQ